MFEKQLKKYNDAKKKIEGEMIGMNDDQKMDHLKTTFTKDNRLVWIILVAIAVMIALRFLFK